jgi:hypothetical protein
VREEETKLTYKNPFPSDTLQPPVEKKLTAAIVTTREET